MWWFDLLLLHSGLVQAAPIYPPAQPNALRAVADCVCVGFAWTKPVPTRTPDLLRIGATFHDRYEIVDVIRSGGMGTVYRARHKITRSFCALKTMQPNLAADSESRARFELEARVTGSIQSDHIVKVFDAGVDAETSMPFLVMELLEGDDLGSMLKQRLDQHCGPFTSKDVVNYVWQVALALTKTHEAGIIHRDLKPENLFLTARDDGSPHLKILDFGIAKMVAESSNAKTTRNVGTPYYMSPEQIRGHGKIDKRADLYALSHVAFTLLVGKAYWEFEAESSQGAIPLLVHILEKGITERATVRAARFGMTLPADFDVWFQRATEQEPSERHGSAMQLVEALSLALGAALPGPSVMREEFGPGLSTRSKRGFSRRLALSVIGVILLLTVAATLTHSRRVATPAVPSNSLTAESPVAEQPTFLPGPSALALPSAPITPTAMPPGTTERSIRRVAPVLGSRAGTGSRRAASPQRDPTDER